MARLIDADLVQNEILKWMVSDGKSSLMALIDDIPTAYNVDKVVEELEEQYCCKNCEFADDIEHCPSGECAEKEVMNDIIKVIKRGGVEK